VKLCIDRELIEVNIEVLVPSGFLTQYLYVLTTSLEALLLLLQLKNRVKLAKWRKYAQKDDTDSVRDVDKKVY
jgi:hypothetical protein